jgi:Na+(H+)/acetate symporter ActP
MNTDFVINLVLFVLATCMSSLFLFYLTATVGISEPLVKLREIKIRRTVMTVIFILIILSIIELQNVFGNNKPVTWVQTLFIVFLIHSFVYAVTAVQNQRYPV